MSSRGAHGGGSGWREAAVDRALRAEERGGYAQYGLLRAIRANRPGVPTLTLTLPSSSRYRRFVFEHTEKPCVLLAAEHWSSGYMGVLAPELSWHVFRWRGEEIEAVTIPAAPDPEVILAGDDAGVLRELAEEIRTFCRKPQGRVLVYSGNSWSADEELEAEIDRASWEDVVLPTDQSYGIRSSIESFFARREAYREMGVAWRRGVLLVGPPGTGKTMVCKAAAASLEEYPFLYVRDLSGRDTHERIIAEVFGRARELAPAVLVFEDIDGFVGDHNRAVFLNELDGGHNAIVFNNSTP